MSIGSIVVDLLARTGSFETDMDRASKTAKKKAKEIDDALSKTAQKVGKALGVAASASAVAMVAWGKSLIDGLDSLNDVADATGSTIEKISALEAVAMETGTSMDTVTAAMVKFNDSLKTADGKNGVSQALKAIGLDAKALRDEDPADALRKTAKALAGFADDGNKARLVQELFGKSVREVSPFLKDLADQTDESARVTAAQTAAAEAFNKQLFALKTNATEAGRAILADLLPGMTRFLQNAREIAAIGGFGLIVKDAAKDLVGLGKMTGNNGADIKQFMRERDRLQKDLDYAQRQGRPTRGIEAELAENARYLQLLRIKQRNEVASLYTDEYGDALSRKEAPRTSVGVLPKDSKGGPKTDKKTEVERYIEGLDKQLQRAKELSTVETALEDIQAGRLGKVTAAEKELVLTRARAVDDTKAMAKYEELAAEAEKTRQDALIRLTEGQEEQAKTLADGNKELKNEIDLIGKNAEEQARIEQARIAVTVAQKEQLLAQREQEGAYQRELDAIRQQIDALKERSGLIGLKGTAEKVADDAKKAEEFAKDMGSAFQSSFEKAAIEGEKLSDVLKSLGKDLGALLLRRLVTQPLVESIFGSSATSGGSSGSGILSSLGSLFSGIFGGFFAEGGVPPLGRISVVGENGPELFVPNTAGRIVPNHELAGAGRGDSYYFTVGDVATVGMLRQAIGQSQRQAAGALNRSQGYGGRFAT
ncbi:hypothetical protein [Xenophilus sp.]|uniref:hypothetical protein n=1 Tax=Xenophilus sp. TaxID=1873499 RepID=UPI0037DCE032